MAYVLLTPDYFTGDALIPEMVDLGSPVNAMAQALESSSVAQLQRAVSQYQYDYLSRLFSPLFAKDFMENVNSVTLPTNKEELFLEAHSKVYISVDQVKYSPAAYYVYYWHMRNSKTTSSMFGEVSIDFTYGRNANNEIKLMDAWNRMVALTKPIYLWANSKRTHFAELGYPIKPDARLLVTINRFGI